jgi:hypothetical protein
MLRGKCNNVLCMSGASYLCVPLTIIPHKPTTPYKREEQGLFAVHIQSKVYKKTFVKAVVTFGEVGEKSFRGKFSISGELRFLSFGQ